MGSGPFKALHDVGKGTVCRCGFRFYFQGTDTGPGDLGNGGLCYHSRHRPHDGIPVCAAVQQGTRDHIARCTVEGIENEEPHYQYL
jgi:hypothetical protein